MYVSAADHGQELESARTHAIEGQIERLVGVDVGEIACSHKLADWLGSGARGQFSLNS